ncbi:MAG: hypothetical protein NW201_05740 [Gemmatimonadales bacterium]|nr:hypothetical protein [Gemmatimonadales bacterium]
MARAALLVLTGALGACAGGTAPEPAPPPAAPAGVPALGLVLDARAARPGDTVAIGLAADAPVPGVQAWLRFDPRRLRWLGQAATPHLVMVNAGGAGEGRLRLAAVAHGGLPSPAADLRFQVLADDWTAGLRLEPEEVVTRDFLAHRTVAVREATRAAFAPAEPLRLDAAAWLARLEAPSGPARALALPGDGQVFGDANLNGLVTVGDVVIVTNTAVGNAELLTVASRDLPVAGDVAPLNLPGLGEAGDPLPPGQELDGTRRITVADATLISAEAAGDDRAVVGEVIPGRRLGVLPRVVLQPADSIVASRVFRRDTIYEIVGTLVVTSALAPNVTLTIEAGTRLEFDPPSNGRLVVRRAANLVANGTRLQPVVFTCKAALPFPGCWGGVHLNGFGLLNNGSTGDGFVGAPEKDGIGGTGRYGGVVDEDDSGTLRFVRIEWAGRPTAAGDTAAALQLLGVGSGTTLEFIQVARSLHDGVFASGGRARVRNLVVSDPGRDALGWSDGWRGAVQQLLVRMGATTPRGGRSVLRGASYDVLPNAIPRSAPELSHVTAWIGSAPAGPLIRLADGTGVWGNGFAVQGSAPGAFGVVVDGAATCANATMNGLLRLTGSVLAVGTPFDATADCLDEQAWFLTPGRANRLEAVGASLLATPAAPAFPDLRVVAGSPLDGAAASPPSDPFFVAFPWVGAVEVLNPFRANTPWYAGWTTGW